MEIKSGDKMFCQFIQKQKNNHNKKKEKNVREKENEFRLCGNYGDLNFNWAMDIS